MSEMNSSKNSCSIAFKQGITTKYSKRTVEESELLANRKRHKTLYRT